MANSYNGKVIITAENRLKEGLDNAKKDVLGFGEATDKLGKNLTNALKVTAIIASLKELGKAAYDCFVEFGEAEERISSLKYSLDITGGSFDRNISLIDNISKKYRGSKDDVEELVKELAQLGRSDDEIEKITKASINLSSVTGKDLQSSFQSINATFEGTTGKLGKLLPELGGLTKEQLALGGATDLINKKFDDLTNKIAEDSIPQKIRNLKEAFGDLKENIGKMTATFFTPMLEGIGSIITAWNNAFAAQETYRKNLKTIADTEKNNEGVRLQAAYDNAVRDRETALRAFNMAQLTTEGTYKIIGGKKSPIYTPETAQKAGAFTDLTSQYYKFDALAASFRISMENFNKENPDWNKPIQQAPTLTTSNLAPTNDPAVNALKSNYTKVDEIVKQVKELIRLNGLNYYSGEESGQILNGLYQEALKADTLTLGPEGTALKQELWNLLAEAFTPSSISNIIVDYITESLTDIRLSTDGGSILPSGFNGASNLDGTEFVDSLTGGVYNAIERAGRFYVLDDRTPWEQLGTNVDTLAQELKKNGTPVFGQSGISYREGAGGASIAEQMDAIQLEWLYDSINTSTSNYGQSTLPYLNNYGGMGSTAQGQVNALEVPKITLFDSLKADAQVFFTDFGNAVSTTIPNILGSGLSGADLLGSLGGMFSGITEALGPLTQIIFSANPLFAALLPIIQGTLNVIGPAISETIQPLFSALDSIGRSLGIALLPILDALSPVFSLLGMLLTSIITPAIQMLSPVISYITFILETVLVPVIKGLIIVFEVLSTPIKFVGDLFEWIGGQIRLFGENIDILFWNLTHWFDPKAYKTGTEFSSDAFTGLEDRINAILNTGSSSMATSTASSTQTSVASASYSGGNTVTINIYQQAPVVGSGGMNEFALMIREKFLELDYYSR